MFCIIVVEPDWAKRKGCDMFGHASFGRQCSGQGQGSSGNRGSSSNPSNTHNNVSPSCVAKIQTTVRLKCSVSMFIIITIFGRALIDTMYGCFG